MWYLIFSLFNVLNILSAIYPFLVKIDIRFNILKLKGVVYITFFNKIKLDFNIRFKHGYIYINHKNKLLKEKITNQNFKVRFFLNLVKQVYFREQMLELILTSNFGNMNDSCVTAVSSGYILVLSKCLFSKIKNNKKSSHIFVKVEPKYNQDIFNIRLVNTVRISLADILYTLLYTTVYTIRDRQMQKYRHKEIL